jgi:hypothetical protein
MSEPTQTTEGAPCVSRLCKRCRWVTWPWRNIRDSGGAICTHPTVTISRVEPDLVNGGTRKLLPGPFCDMERRDLHQGHCGPEGAHWEPV